MNIFNIRHVITDSLVISSRLAVSTKMGRINRDFVFLTVIEMMCFLLQFVFLRDQYYPIFDTRYSIINNRAKMGHDRSGLEIYVNFGSGWVGSRKLDPRPTL